MTRRVLASAQHLRVAGTLVALGLSLLTACSPTAQWRPAPGAELAANSDEVAVGRAEEVVVVVHPSAWPGSARDARLLTPMRLEVVNTGETAVLVERASIALVVDGHRYPALSPERVPVASQPTTVGRTAAEVDSESGVYEFRHHDPDAVALRREVVARALPEGTLHSGRVSGYVYFGTLPREATQASLELELGREEEGAIARLTVPLARR